MRYQFVKNFRLAAAAVIAELDFGKVGSKVVC